MLQLIQIKKNHCIIQSNQVVTLSHFALKFIKLVVQKTNFKIY